MGTATRGGNKLMAAETPNFKLKKPDRTDFVNIKEQLSDNMDIIDTEIKEAQEKADQAFQSASNGKTLIKNAITGVDPEVTIPNDATFAQLAAAIGQIETGVNTDDATATAEKILAGMTAYVKGVKVTGAMPNRSGTTLNAVKASSQTADVFITPQMGFYDGNSAISKVYEPNFRAENLLGGKTYFGMEGGITTKVAQTYTPGTTDQTIAAGQYLSGAQTIKGDSNLISANILSGKSIFGVAGSVIAGKRFASGLYTSGSNYAELQYNNSSKNSNSTYTEEFWIMPISGLSFTPTIVIYYCTQPENTWHYPMGMASSITEDGVDAHYGRAFATLSSGFTFKLGWKNINYLYMRAGGFCVPLHRTTSLGTYREYCWIAIE